MSLFTQNETLSKQARGLYKAAKLSALPYFSTLPQRAVPKFWQSFGGSTVTVRVYLSYYYFNGLLAVVNQA